MYWRYPKPIKWLLTKLFCKKVPYLDEIGVDCYSRNHFGGIDSWGSLQNCIKQNRRTRKLGIDPRDCWDLDTSFFQWLYCELTQLLEDTNCDLTYRSYEHNGKTYTEGDYIEYLRDLCKQILLFDEFKDCPELDWDIVNAKEGDERYSTIEWKNSQEEWEKFHAKNLENIKECNALEKEVFDVFYELLHALWW